MLPTTAILPVDTSDSALPEDQRRPRMITENILGNTVSKTYYSFKKDPDGFKTEISEQCANPNAAFGDPSNLRTIRTYYPSGTGTADSGGIKQVQYPDGRMDSYTYEYGVYVPGTNPGEGQFTAGSGVNIRTTVAHGTVDNPSGIANKTTKDISISDEFGSQLTQGTYVYTGSGYERIQWINSYYDDFGRVTKEIRSDGTQQEKTWDCCHLTSATDARGMTTAYTYDALGRASTTSRPGPSGMIITSYSYDAAGRKLSQTISAGGLSQAAANQYDTAGRLIQTLGTDGLITGYVYADWEPDHHRNPARRCSRDYRTVRRRQSQTGPWHGRGGTIL